MLPIVILAHRTSCQNLGAVQRGPERGRFFLAMAGQCLACLSGILCSSLVGKSKGSRLCHGMEIWPIENECREGSTNPGSACERGEEKEPGRVSCWGPLFFSSSSSSSSSSSASAASSGRPTRARLASPLRGSLPLCPFR